MATLDDIARRVNEYRDALKQDVDSAASDLQNVGGGGAFNSEGGLIRPPALLAETSHQIDTQESSYERVVSTGNRRLDVPDQLDTSPLEFQRTVDYDTTDYNETILAADDKNIKGWAKQPLDDYTVPLWANGTITVADISDIKSKGFSAARQLDAMKEGWEQAQFDANFKMDMAGASLGARGFRKANSWLKMKQLDVIREFTDQFYVASKKIVSEANAILKANVQQALELLTQMDATNMEFNSGVASVCDTISKIFYAVKGLSNDINIDSWQVQHGTDLMKREVGLKRSLTLLQGVASIHSELFKAKQSIALGKFEAETLRIQQELDIQSTNAKLDIEQQKKMVDAAMTRITSFYAATRGMIALDKSQFADRVKALTSIFGEYHSMLGSSGSSALGVMTGKG